MKNILLHSALVALLTLGAPIAIQAQNPAATTTSGANTSTKAKPIPYKGTIKAIDTAANTITIATAKGDMVLTLSPSTKILNDKKVAKITDMTMGEKVTGSYTQVPNGPTMAFSVHGRTK